MACAARTAYATRTRPGVTVAHGPRLVLSPRYKVLLFNDKITQRRDVIQALIAVIKDMNIPEAAMKTEEAHMTGRAVLRVCPQEQAETYCQQLRGRGLTSRIESIE